MCPDMPMDTRKSVGGTMVMWRTKLGPYIKTVPTTSTAILPIIVSLPGFSVTAHIAIYLPTSGREAEFVSALASLEACLELINEDYACPVYIRGDANVNPNNLSRVSLFKHFCSKHKLISLDLAHPTHHHFIGNGLSDTQLDILLYRGPPEQRESLHSIVCKLDNPLIQSHHDLNVSSFPLSQIEAEN